MTQTTGDETSEPSEITNQWGNAERIQLNPEEHMVFRGRENYGYNHHPQITSLNSRLYVTWSSGTRHEDDVGQRMMIATSEDGGERWSYPARIVDRYQEGVDKAVVTSMGLYPHDDSLVAFYGLYTYTQWGLREGHRREPAKRNSPLDEQWHERVHTETKVSKDGGRTWSSPTVILEDFIPNHPPSRLANGRLLMPGNLTFPYTDDPYGISGWQVSGIPGLPDNYVDDPEGFSEGCYHRGDDTYYCEGSFFQHEDGTIWMLLRTGMKQLAVTESKDGGETWSEPVMTNYTDCGNRFEFGRLPDGRYYGLSCPDPEKDRTPLVLAVSEDGTVFDRHYVLGMEPTESPRDFGFHKHGRYCYPTSTIVDDTMYVLYSIYKEDIGLKRVDLTEL